MVSIKTGEVHLWSFSASAPAMQELLEGEMPVLSAVVGVVSSQRYPRPETVLCAPSSCPTYRKKFKQETANNSKSRQELLCREEIYSEPDEATQLAKTR